MCSKRSEEFVVRAYNGGTKKATHKSTLPYWKRYLAVKDCLPSRLLFLFSDCSFCLVSTVILYAVFFHIVFLVRTYNKVVAPRSETQTAVSLVIVFAENMSMLALQAFLLRILLHQAQVISPSLCRSVTSVSYNNVCTFIHMHLCQRL